MIVHGMYVLDTPLDGGTSFSHRTAKLISSTIILLGIFLNDRVLLIALALYFITQICLSISGTCSLFAVVLSMTPRMSSLRHSNYLSISAVFMLKPRVEYISNTFLSELIRLVLLRFGTYSFVVNFMFLDAITRNPSPSTNITSAVSVTLMSFI
jgi:glycerol uptake facilitator-like aquaporin